MSRSIAEARNRSSISTFLARKIVERDISKLAGLFAHFGVPYRFYFGTKTDFVDFIEQNRAFDSLGEDLGIYRLDLQNGETKFKNMKFYSAPHPNLRSVLPTNPPSEGDVILTSNKPSFVILEVVLAEGRDDGSGIKPLEGGGDGILVRDSAASHHEFDSLEEAISFAASQHDLDRNPVRTTVFEFKEGGWKTVQVVA